MASQSKVWVQRVFDPLRPAREYSIESDEFNRLVDLGYDYITFFGPNYRLTASVDDWLDYGRYDMVDDVDVIVLRTSRMEKA
jgi:hypothetical protein